MAMIFLGGSREIYELPSPAIERIGAIIAAEHQPPTMEFVCLDQRLAVAAGREGFRIVHASPSSR